MVEHKSVDRPAAGSSNTAAGFVREQLARGRKPNRLLSEKSPYLLQHAFNPVDWYSWGEEAFVRAVREDRPVFLSIGYSTCHWCHVMARESFDDQATAAILNESFICIKVDREERPDLDQIYMAATRSMAGGGGWPLSVFLTPDRRPFYAGTYFPPVGRGGLPSFSELLRGVTVAWRDDRQHILDIAGSLTEKLREMSQTEPGLFPMSKEVLATGFRQLVAEYDSTYGGFSRAPKFPRPVGLNLLLRYYWRTRDESSLAMILHTLHSMAAGGMYDQLGGGFHRYSVDQQWRVPHFEKMLYDQAQLAMIYLEAYQLTGISLLARIGRATLDYVLLDLTGPHGAFYSAEDADSPRPENPAEHSEGAFYLWTAAEIGSLLGREEAAIFNYCFGVAEKGNALIDPHGEFTGRNILYAARTPDEAATHFGQSIQDIEIILKEACLKLFARRNRRPRPQLDDKVITAWNGLMISALAKGYQILAEERYLKAARGAAAFVLNELHDATTGLLSRRYREGEAGLEAQLDDYAFFIQGLLDLYEASLDIWWLEQAVKLTDRQIELFADEQGGGFFDTSGRDHTVLVRMKSDYDGAEPAGNSVAALNLLRLSWITDNRYWRQQAERTLAAFADVLSQFPLGMPQMAVAHDFQLATPRLIVIAGLPEAEDTRHMLRQVNRCFLPHRILLLADGGKGQQWLAQHLPFIADIKMLEGRATAYICENYTCKLPTDDPDRLHEMLSANREQQAVTAPD